MPSLRATMSGAAMASAPFSNAIRTPNLAIRVGAAARTILRCDRAGGKTWHAAHRQHGRSGLTAPRLGIASSHITTCVASKLPRNQRLEQERAILIGLSNKETDHERKRSGPIEQSAGPSA